jgi:hypothetical protein
MTCRLCRQYQAIILDEFQDTSRVQLELLKLLASHGRVTVVGDDDQSLFSFSGADPRNFLQFFDHFSASQPAAALPSQHQTSPTPVFQAQDQIPNMNKLQIAKLQPMQLEAPSVLQNDQSADARRLTHYTGEHDVDQVAAPAISATALQISNSCVCCLSSNDADTLRHACAVPLTQVLPTKRAEAPPCPLCNAPVPLSAKEVFGPKDCTVPCAAHAGPMHGALVRSRSGGSNRCGVADVAFPTCCDELEPSIPEDACFVSSAVSDTRMVSETLCVSETCLDSADSASRPSEHGTGGPRMEVWDNGPSPEQGATSPPPEHGINSPLLKRAASQAQPGMGMRWVMSDAPCIPRAGAQEHDRPARTLSQSIGDTCALRSPGVAECFRPASNAIVEAGDSVKSQQEQGWQGVACVALGTNYRCPQNVVDAASALITHNSARLAKRLEAYQGEGALSLLCRTCSRHRAAHVSTNSDFLPLSCAFDLGALILTPRL